VLYSPFFQPPAGYPVAQFPGHPLPAPQFGALPPYPTFAYPAFPTFPVPVAPIKAKLVYFNGRGRAELIRLILALTGVEYEDVRFKPTADNAENPSRPNDEFAEFKKTGVSLTGQVPYLEIDGLRLVQSVAIARYLSGKYGLLGNGTDRHRVEIDMVVDTVEDLRNKFSQFYHEKDADRKEALTQEFWQTHFVKYAQALQNFIEANPVKSGFFVGERLSLADLVAYDALYMLSKLNPEAAEAFPKLIAHTTLVGAIPQIAKWVETRPETPF
jgi:glutathione S-transferase